MTNQILTQDRLKELYNYNPETGVFTWKVCLSNRKPIGSKAGCLTKGYVIIRVDGKYRAAHKLAWLYVHGVMPSSDIFHKNGNREDNRICNLDRASVYDDITQEKLKEILNYDKDTGIFTWKIPLATKISIGDKAGGYNSDNYITIGINGKLYLAHRLAWLYIHGEYPDNCIDHINHDRSDNRISNLRVVTRSENQKNMSIPINNNSGVIGVHWDKERRKWFASIQVNGKTKALGRYNSKEVAIIIRKAAELIYNFHENHGKAA